VCGVVSPDSGYGPLAGCCECGDEPSGSGATELVSYGDHIRVTTKMCVLRLSITNQSSKFGTQ
jgi:hypothetical protein